MLDREPGDVIAQAFAPGREFGVFYYRYPEEERGHILSINEKQFPHVTGDGKKNLERLILDDDRAVCMARFHLRAHSDRLFDVPAEGEEIQLVQVRNTLPGRGVLERWSNRNTGTPAGDR